MSHYRDRMQPNYYRRQESPYEHEPMVVPPHRVQRQQVSPPVVSPWQRLWRQLSHRGSVVLAGGSALALAVVLINPAVKSPPDKKVNLCQQSIQADARLSRDELSELLAVPERSPKQVVREIIAEPFCLMSSVEVREGVQAEREAYPLEFDPQTWFVVLYEGDEYAGYDFSFQR